MSELHHVGSRTPRIDGLDKVTGAARYVDDIPTPQGTLHLAFGLSTAAAGRLDAMSLDAVRAAPGVVAVITADPALQGYRVWPVTQHLQVVVEFEQQGIELPEP